MRIAAILVLLSIGIIPDVTPQAFLCLFDREPLLDWIECLKNTYQKIVQEEGLSLQRKFFKGLTTIEITVKLCKESPNLIAQYTDVLAKLAKKIPPDVMELAVYQTAVCSNNTAFKFPLKDKDGVLLDPYNITLENIENFRPRMPAPASA